MITFIYINAYIMLNSISYKFTSMVKVRSICSINFIYFNYVLIMFVNGTSYQGNLESFVLKHFKDAAYFIKYC